MKTWTVKEWVLLCLTLTACIVILVPVAGLLVVKIKHPEMVVNDEIVKQTYNALLYILGVVSGVITSHLSPREPREESNQSESKT
jgi:hypothetical protein